MKVIEESVCELHVNGFVPGCNQCFMECYGRLVNVTAERMMYREALDGLAFDEYGVPTRWPGKERVWKLLGREEKEA